MNKTFMRKISLSLGLAAFTVVNAQGSAQATTQYNLLGTVNPTLAAVELDKASKPVAKTMVSPSIQKFNKPQQEIHLLEDVVEPMALLEASTLLPSEVASHDFSNVSPLNSTIALDVPLTLPEKEISIKTAEDLKPSALLTASTSAEDLLGAIPKPTFEETVPASEEESTIAQFGRSGFLFSPGDIFIGVAGVINSEEGDFFDAAIHGKLKLFSIGGYDLSVRPYMIFQDDDVGFRVPATIDFLQTNPDWGTLSRKVTFFGGAGFAFDTGGGAFAMINGGADYLLTRRFTLTGSLNVLFFGDTQVEFLVGVGYNL